MKATALLISIQDNVATALEDITDGQAVTISSNDMNLEITATNPIPYGHKMAVKKILKGDEIIKYGEIIGRATADISPGCHAHVDNIESLRGRGDLENDTK